MSVELKVKDKDGKPHYVAVLFDPNATTSHVRFASDDMRTLEGLTLKAFIKAESIYNHYYKNSDETSLIFVRPSAPAQAQAEPARENRGAGAVENRTLTSCIEGEQLNETALYYMLEYGFAGDIRRLKNEIAKRPQLLESKNVDGTPGLYLAFQEGHADAIRAIGEVLVELEVQLDKCLELLAAKGADGTPGLSMALQEGHADAIAAFGQGLEKLKVPPDECAELLKAKNRKGAPGLYWALRNGKLDAVKQYTQIVKKIAPELSEEQRASLLKTIRESYRAHEKLNKNNPDFYQQFKDFYPQLNEMENALKERTQ
jgi:hypothetical protein